MERTYILAGPLSLVLYQGRIGFWSQDEQAERLCVWLDPPQTALLSQFSRCPQRADQAASAAGVEYDSGVQELVQQLLRHRILREHAEPDETPYYALHHPNRQGPQTDCAVDASPLGAEEVGVILAELRRSQLIGGNALSTGFAGSRGFGVKFRREAIPRVLQWLPWTRPYFDRILWNSELARQLGRMQDTAPNAFFFNALMIPPGRGAAIHYDRSLDNRTLASFVSVLYLQAPAPPGGRLFLYDGAWPVGLVNPRPGMLIHFRGDLRHGVSDTEPSDCERVSLVCEHYCLPATSLQQCPYFELVVRD